MDDDHFYSSLQELKHQLDLMNKRTALFLQQHSLQDPSPNMSPPETSLLYPSIFDRRPVDKPQIVPMQQFDQKLHALEAQQKAMAEDLADRFTDMENELDSLSEQVNHMHSGKSQFTPPESPTPSTSPASPTPSISPTFPTPSTLSVHDTLNPGASPLDTSTMSRPPATVADLGGYFYPNRHHATPGDMQYISDASIFVGRVNRALRTKSIQNLESYLKGSALRWFHIGLSLDGSHSYDDDKGQMDLTKFCESLIYLFGIPGFVAEESHEQARYLIMASMRSNILEEYAFPALEALRRQTTLGQPDVDANAALRKAVLKYNKDHPMLSVDLDILSGQDVLVDLARLRQQEFDIRREGTSLTLKKLHDPKAMSGQDAPNASNKSTLVHEFLSTSKDAAKVDHEDVPTQRPSSVNDKLLPSTQINKQSRSTDQEGKVDTHSVSQDGHQQQPRCTQSVSRACKTEKFTRCQTQKFTHKTKRSPRTVVQPGTFWSNSDSTKSGTPVHGEIDSGTSRPSDIPSQSMFTFPCFAPDPCPMPPHTLCPPPPSDLNLTPDVNRRLKELQGTTSHDASDSKEEAQGLEIPTYGRAKPLGPKQGPVAPVTVDKSHMRYQHSVSHLPDDPTDFMDSFASAKNSSYRGYPQLNTTYYAPETAVDCFSGYPRLPFGPPVQHPLVHPTAYRPSEGLFAYSHPRPTQRKPRNLPSVIPVDYHTLYPGLPGPPPQSTNALPPIEKPYRTYYNHMHSRGPTSATSTQAKNYSQLRSLHDDASGGSSGYGYPLFSSVPSGFMTPKEDTEMIKDMEIEIENPTTTRPTGSGSDVPANANAQAEAPAEGSPAESATPAPKAAPKSWADLMRSKNSAVAAGATASAIAYPYSIDKGVKMEDKDDELPSRLSRDGRF
ncbi:hypothetical protein D6D12_00874 [Aureobasidium pullulans]|uniref:Uncharacterized protein n=1 Tax=Aureobasidium pullulans TaxID=5580 RepID=A0AB74K6D5_AURPU|nr:hypothetical protein D6D12_00874 [Aureobasidium pullulans]THX45700.1 hypothetical protein D6D11_07230 [Aureobasidium pullulans]